MGKGVNSSYQLPPNEEHLVCWWGNTLENICPFFLVCCHFSYLYLMPLFSPFPFPPAGVAPEAGLEVHLALCVLP